MRYNHNYHRRAKGTPTHRLRTLLSIGLLLVAMAVISLSLKQPINIVSFLNNFSWSLYRVSMAYIVSLVLGLFLGMLTVSSKSFESLLLPVMDLAQSFPTFAVLPVLIFYFGASSASVIIILVIAMVWPIVFNVISGIKEQRQDQAEAAKIFGANGWRHFYYYRWPMLRPSLITGSIISWGQAWDTIVGAEIIAGVAGAGHYLGKLGDKGNSAVLAFGICIYLLLIFIINQLIWLPLLHQYTRYQAES